MPPTQLKCSSLAPGDILLKLGDGSLLGHAIRIGQSLAGQVNPQVIHAGLMFDRTYILEAQGAGISANDLRVQNKKYGYLVFRCTNANVAAGAATFGKVLFDVHQRAGNLVYSVPGAVGSLGGPSGAAASRTAMDDMMDAILAGRNRPFFCSQFVVMVYQFTAEQNGIAGNSLFRDTDRSVSPSTLASRLKGHPMFREAGYLMPNER
jgi:hypothetical protein